jgi:lipoate-protein ligase A
MRQEQWLVLDSGPGEAAFNMALDEALLEFASQINGPVLRFYGWTEPAASFGYFQKFSDVESVTSLRPLIRRPTGGGLVPHDTDWTYSVTIPPQHPWYNSRAAESYQRMHQWIQSAFAPLGVTTELAPCCRKEIPGQCFAGYEKSDLLWLGRKIAGAAQRRTKMGLLIQGSVQPAPQRVSREQWQNAMRSVAPACWTELRNSEPVIHRARDLAAAKYSRDEHNRRR